MPIQTAIRQIIDEVPSGCVFDSHFVIVCLLEKYSDEYLEFASSVNAGTNKTLAVHGKIGQEIARFENADLARLTHESWSKNIHGNDSRCTCWRKR